MDENQSEGMTVSESPETEIVPQETTPSKKEKISKTQQVKNLISSKLDSGYELKDKNSVDELTKIVCDELQIKLSSWHSKIKNNIRDIAVKKGIQISDLGFRQNKIGDMSLTVIKKESETPEPEINPNVPNVLPKDVTAQSPFGTLPKQESENTGQLESTGMSQSAQEKLISNGLTKLIFPIYTSLGIIELDESEKEQEAKPLKGATARAEFEGLAKDLNEFLLENNIQLPAFLNYASIGISIFMVLVLPILKFKFFLQNSDAKPEYDETEVEVRV